MREKLIELHSVLCRSIYAEYDEAQRAPVIDLLKTAENLIANGVTIQKWIPVAERLPEKSGSYLVCSDREAVYETRFYPKKHFQNGYMREAGFTKRGKTIITHWMYMPEPPKGE